MEGCVPLSSPQIPATPILAPLPLQSVDPHTTLDCLFAELGDIISVEEFEAECKRWRGCTREEWLKGTEGA